MFVVRVDKHAREMAHSLWVAPEAPVLTRDNGISRIEPQVNDGAEVQVEPELLKSPSQPLIFPLSKGCVATSRGSPMRQVALATPLCWDPLNSTAFLIDADQKRAVARCSGRQVRDKPAHGGQPTDVSVHENHTADLS